MKVTASLMMGYPGRNMPGHNHFQFFPNIITKLIHYTIGKMSSYYCKKHSQDVFCGRHTKKQKNTNKCTTENDQITVRVLLVSSSLLSTLILKVDH